MTVRWQVSLDLVVFCMTNSLSQPETKLTHTLPRQQHQRRSQSNTSTVYYGILVMQDYEKNGWWQRWCS